MNTQQLVAIVLIMAGALALAYGGFTYTKDTHKADIGPLHMEVKEREYVNVPMWAGIGAIVIGGALLVLRRKI
jgi:TRAP-type C4-dicarboxylate transport system permease small subunit